MLDALGEGGQDLVLEVRARVRGDDLGAGLGGDAVEGDAQYVGLDTGRDEFDLGAQVVRDLRRRVQGDAVQTSSASASLMPRWRRKSAAASAPSISNRWTESR